MQRPSQPITGASCQRPHTSAKGALRANGHRQLFFIQFSLFFFAGVSLYSLGIHHLSARAQLATGALVLVVASLALFAGSALAGALADGSNADAAVWHCLGNRWHRRAMRNLIAIV